MRQGTLDRRVQRRLFALGTAFIVACGATGQERVELKLYVAGQAGGAEVSAKNGVAVTLTRSDLAFGPLYLCAGVQSGEVCDTARLEWLDSVVIDTLDAGPKYAGPLTGVTGPVRSWMYDLGISSQLTHDDPLVLDAAAELGGVSLLAEGSAALAGAVVTFRAAIPIRQGSDAEQGVPVVRRSTTDPFDHEVTIDEQALVVRFDPRPWFSGVDFETLVADSNCAEDTPGGACTLELDADSEAFRSVSNSLTAGARPTFKWKEIQ